MTASNNLSALAPLARSLKKGAPSNSVQPGLNLSSLKAELRLRLADSEHGGILGREGYISDAENIPIYEVNRPVARFLLLSAYHDGVEDAETPGLIVKGRPAVSPCLTFSGYTDDRHLSLEHIAPRSASSGWDVALWENKELIHRIGNLVLVQSKANSSLSDRPWNQKRVLYAALSAPSSTEARRILDASETIFRERTQEIAEMSAHLPHLAAVSKITDDWRASFVQERTRRLLGLAWDQLYPWLEG